MVRRLTAAAIAVLTAGAFGAWGHSVHAQTIPISDVIAFQGNATITADNVGGCGDAVPDLFVPAVHAETAAVDLVGGCGSFSFNSTVCAGYSDGDPVVGAEVGACAIVSTGSFSNTVCGTGSVAAGANATVGGVEGATVTFGITFDATIGIVTGSITDTTGDGAGQTEPILEGVVQLGPGGNPLTQDGPVDCTNGFSIAGVVIAGEGPGS